MAIGGWQERPTGAIHLATGDPARATELFRRSFPGIELTCAADGSGFAFAFDRAGDGRMTVNRLRLTGDAVGDGSIGEGFGVARLRGGRFDLEYGRSRIDTSRPYLRPAGRSRARMRDAHVQLIEIDPDAFAVAAALRLEGTGRRVHAPSPGAAGVTAPGLVTPWHRIADLVTSVAFDEQAFASPLIRAGLFDLLVSGLLATFPIASEGTTSARSGARPAAVRRALEYVDGHLAEPIDVASIAEAARLPVRTLQTAFRSQLGVTPMEHVRRRRLAAAREDLIEAEPGSGASVATIARGRGFAHLARFAEQYRRAYGENPSETLRR